MSVKITQKQFEKFCRGLKLPEGFSGEFGPAPNWPEILAFTVKNAEPTIKITFNQDGAGTTEFLAPGHGWLTFDRRGVEQSFYFVDYKTNKIDEKANVCAIFAAQLDRIAKRLEYYESAVKVPGMPGGNWTLAPDQVETYKSLLRKGQSVSFTPAGFGTGYRITTSRRSLHPSRYNPARACSPELASFFGVPQLWYETTDCD